MQSEQLSLQDANNKLSAEVDAAQTPTFIDHLLNMPTDDGEFLRMDVQLRDFD
jgi:hypothetical protein